MEKRLKKDKKRFKTDDKKLVKKKKPQIRVSYPTGHHTIEDLQILEFEENQSFLKRSFLIIFCHFSKTVKIERDQCKH